EEHRGGGHAQRHTVDALGGEEHLGDDALQVTSGVAEGLRQILTKVAVQQRDGRQQRHYPADGTPRGFQQHDDGDAADDQVGQGGITDPVDQVIEGHIQVETAGDGRQDQRNIDQQASIGILDGGKEQEHQRQYKRQVDTALQQSRHQTVGGGKDLESGKQQGDGDNRQAQGFSCSHWVSSHRIRQRLPGVGNRRAKPSRKSVQQTYFAVVALGTGMQ